MSWNPPIRFRFSLRYHCFRSLSSCIFTSACFLPSTLIVLLTNFFDNYTMLVVNHPSSESDCTFSWVRKTTMKSLLGLIGLCERQIGIMIDFVSLFIKISRACISFIKSLKFAIAIVNTKISCLASVCVLARKKLVNLIVRVLTTLKYVHNSVTN